MNLKSYDFFIITISSRFTENSLWLAQTLYKIRKPYFFVRSKLDIELQNQRKHKPDMTEDQVISALRADIVSHSSELPVAPEIFILSGELENSDRWEFAKLKKRVLEVLPDVKRNTLVVSLGGYASDLIDAKYQVLKHRIYYYSAASSLGAIVPIPGFSFGVDTTLIIKMAHEFAKAFGLTNSQVRQSYVRVASRTEVVNIIGKAGALFTAKTVIKIIGSQATSSIAEEALSLIPLLGQGAAAVLSFVSTYHCGKVILKKMTTLAKQMAREIIRYETEQGIEVNQYLAKNLDKEMEEDDIDIEELVEELKGKNEKNELDQINEDVEETIKNDEINDQKRVNNEPNKTPNKTPNNSNSSTPKPVINNSNNSTPKQVINNSNTPKPVINNSNNTQLEAQKMYK